MPDKLNLTTSSHILMVISAGTAYSPLSNENEESTARLCDSGLPDPDVCDVLITPSLQKDILEEAWARG